MKRLTNWLLTFFLLITFYLLLTPVTHAQTPDIQITPQPCYGACPSGVEYKDGKCTSDFSEYMSSPSTMHYWMEDPEITAQGKANERARQFIYWALNTNAIDSSPALTQIWNTSRNISYFLVILVSAILGIGIIVGQRANFNLRIKIWPQVIKIGGALLYITFSAAIVLLLIQLSEILMKFFIENLGGKDLFNIYFASNTLAGGTPGTPSPGSSELNYVQFVGCRDINIRVQESVRSEMFMLKLTNFTYYTLGTMIILRKVLLWFMLFVAPFLAILLPFTFIRNIGLIWIGVFFQWLFYGPLMSLFLGGLSRIWKAGIPFVFNFSRVGNFDTGYIYPTATNITFGGPAQVLGPLNSSNYIDTFAEYVITLIMLWAVIIFPWWLLRIFRDYCCDGIIAAKNILLSMYDQMRGGPPPPPPQPVPQPSRTNISMNLPKDVEIPIKVHLETIQEIKKAHTEDIMKSINISATKLTDVARFETNKNMNEEVRKNIQLLQNPMKAETPSERQRYMNIRTELFNRAIKEDGRAKQVLSSISTVQSEQVQHKETLVRDIAPAPSVDKLISIKVKVTPEQISGVNTTFVTQTTTNNDFVEAVAQQAQAPAPLVQNVINSFTKNITQEPIQVVENIAKEVTSDKSQVVKILKSMQQVVKQKKELVSEIAKKQNIKEQDVVNILDTQVQIATTADKAIEESISIPPTISLEDYEAVKKMWRDQYEKGEVPVSENIKGRDEWVSKDIVFITNALNKLTAQDLNIRQQGLDDVGYILPIFMINNFKGQELMVYLKAKLEAAKTVQEQMDRESKIREEVQSKQDEIQVSVERPKQEEKAQEMSMQQEQTLPEESPKSEGK